LLGAIAGDVIGSVFEFHNTDDPDFDLFCARSRFTDDTVLTLAVADHILNGGDYETLLKRYARAHPNRGYGRSFGTWVVWDRTGPYNSFGNGSAMRVSPVGFAFDSLEAVLGEAQRSAEVTHNHPEGIKGAQAVAAAIFLARTTKDKEIIKKDVSRRFGYDLNRTLSQIKANYSYDVTCQGSVPESIIAFLESNGFEDCIRKAVLLGGDSDTIACIAGGIAQAFYGGVPEGIVREVRERLSAELLAILDAFNAKCGLKMAL